MHANLEADTVSLLACLAHEASSRRWRERRDLRGVAIRDGMLIRRDR
jgi:hypothetical protein